MRILRLLRAMVFIAIVIAAAPCFAGRLAGKVVEVMDGDTLTIQTRGGEFFRVRLEEIDAPELSQTFGRQARQFLQDLALERLVTVEYETVDLYRRLIGVVVLWNGEVANDALVKNGLAWHYRVHYPPHDHLRELEYKAWKAKLGLWVETDPIPPWKFRNDTYSHTPPANPSRVDYNRIFSYGLIGDPRTKIYLWPACAHYPQPDREFAVFGSKLEAEAAGFKPSPGCYRK